ncbi:SCO family protein [Aestuariirhabdus sp. Z084]|uniref:SCO family protein n=1 Tax=Aestuariirhabdus haliotis TaxID=2918751 RepID=UPI00201B3616|nr:SCO family protein [Aestuariirhabdus haliotis]MCL6415184.1 SCO family protein [Aestuariirhabdus haliotis]MCL6420059.1 SCO family protein [Aestuariirhabdus haliotis]
MSRFYQILIPIMIAMVTVAAGVQYYLYQEQSAARERPPAPPFTLTSSKGPVSLQQLQGKAVVLYFGYASCPDICPIDLGIVGGALKQLNTEEHDKVQALFITLDPARDNLRRLGEYAAFFHPRLGTLRGTEEQIASVARSYGVIYEKTYTGDDPSVYWVSHSANFFLINPEGQLVATLPRETTPSELSTRIRSVIN